MRHHLYRYLVCGLAVLSLASMNRGSADDSPETAATWKQFVAAGESGDEPVLPDFSYAGYRFGEVPIPDVEAQRFDVTDHGAIPDDGKSDQEAIQKAIDAATASGGGIVFFPPGKFLVNTDPKNKRSIRLTAGNLILRGSGCGLGGTVLQMVHPLDPRDPTKMFSTPCMFIIGKPQKKEALAKITADARRETYRIEVDDTSRLNPGMWISLDMESTAAVNTYLHPFEPEAAWTRLTNTGIGFEELHTVKAVRDHVVELGEPLRAGVLARHGWSVNSFRPLEQIGVEDICFLGSWHQKFVHHRSALDDSGFSALQLRQVANSWVRRCSFVNWNQALTISTSAATSVLQVRIAGNRGHGSVYIRGGGDGVLVGLTRDTARHHHGPSVGYRSSGCVFWRYEMHPSQSIDSHSGTPIATLMDRVDGGVLRGSGGPLAGLPNHLRHYVLWNFNHRGRPPRQYDFWRKGRRDRFVKPIIVGMHGARVRFAEDSIELNESPGTPVQPESLYEAQLRLRLGHLPGWVQEARAAWAPLSQQPLPGDEPSTQGQD